MSALLFVVSFFLCVNTNLSFCRFDAQIGLTSCHLLQGCSPPSIGSGTGLCCRHPSQWISRLGESSRRYLLIILLGCFNGSAPKSLLKENLATDGPPPGSTRRHAAVSPFLASGHKGSARSSEFRALPEVDAAPCLGGDLKASERHGLSHQQERALGATAMELLSRS